METQASIAGLLLQRYVEAGGDTYPAEINQHAAAAQVSLEQVLNMGNAPPGFADVTSTGLQLMRDAARAAELRRIGNLDLARQVLEEIVPIFRGYRLTLEDLTARDLAEVSNLRARANDAGQLTLWVLVASGGFGLVFAFAVALFITRSIAGPLGALENAANGKESGLPPGARSRLLRRPCRTSCATKGGHSRSPHSPMRLASRKKTFSRRSTASCVTGRPASSPRRSAHGARQMIRTSRRGPAS